MGQVANLVVVGCPHHITRGGNQRQQATLSGSFAESRSLLFFQLEVARPGQPRFKPAVAAKQRWD